MLCRIAQHVDVPFYTLDGGGRLPHGVRQNADFIPAADGAEEIRGLPVDIAAFNGCSRFRKLSDGPDDRGYERQQEQYGQSRAGAPGRYSIFYVRLVTS
jgi:hypothetical protein